MRTVTVELSEILSLVSCADDYGFVNDVLFDALAEFAGYTLSDEEISEFAGSFLEPKQIEAGYGQEDADMAVERLEEWRRRYFDSVRARDFRERHQ